MCLSLLAENTSTFQYAEVQMRFEGLWDYEGEDFFFLANNEDHMCLEQCEGENFLFWVN